MNETVESTYCFVGESATAAFYQANPDIQFFSIMGVFTTVVLVTLVITLLIEKVVNLKRNHNRRKEKIRELENKVEELEQDR